MYALFGMHVLHHLLHSLSLSKKKSKQPNKRNQWAIAEHPAAHTFHAHLGRRQGRLGARGWTKAMLSSSVKGLRDVLRVRSKSFSRSFAGVHKF